MTRGTPALAKPGTASYHAVVLPPAVLASAPETTSLLPRLVGQRVGWHGRVTAIHRVPLLLCLGAVRDDSGVVVWDSLWLHHTPGIRALNLAVGEEIAFVARVDKQLDGSYLLYRPLKTRRVAATA